MATDGWIQFGVRCHVLENMARSFYFHRCKAEQKRFLKFFLFHFIDKIFLSSCEITMDSIQ